MIIIGADYHPGFQQIAFVDTDTGEFVQLANAGEHIHSALPHQIRFVVAVAQCRVVQRAELL